MTSTSFETLTPAPTPGSPGPLTAMIVDDDPLARDRIRWFLEKDGRVEVVQECETGKSALSSLQELAPDVLFLDIELPGLDGFETLEALGHPARLAVIFTTAYSEHAWRAFEHDAVDYLLKPYSQDRFAQALTRVRAYLVHEADDPPAPSAPARVPVHEEPSERTRRSILFFRERGLLVQIDEIRWLRSHRNYVEIRLDQGRSYHVRGPLQKILERLDPEHFVRVHRTCAIQLSKVAQILAAPPGGLVQMDDGSKVPFSRTYRGDLYEILRDTSA